MSKLSLNSNSLQNILDASGSIDIEVSNQSNLIPQIKAALQGKAIQRDPNAPKFQAKTVVPSTNEQTVTYDEGYAGLSRVYVSGDGNLAPENIVDGVTIFGVEGNARTSSESNGLEIWETGTVTEEPKTCSVDIVPVDVSTVYVIYKKANLISDGIWEIETTSSYISGASTRTLTNVITDSFLLAIWVPWYDVEIDPTSAITLITSTGSDSEELSLFYVNEDATEELIWLSGVEQE